VAFRAFVGTPLAREPRLDALLDALAATSADLKVVEGDHLHVTLSFLGDVPDDAAPRLAAALDEAARRVAPFELALEGVGAFPNARRPRVVWAGAADPRPLADLASRVRERLAEAGFPGDDKEFRAHVTLARVRSERGIGRLVDFLRDHGRDALPSFPVREAVLFRSDLSPHGATHRRLHEARLEG
jgi:2'-5' RNA ligase